MHKALGIVELHAAVKNLVEEKTGLLCLDKVEINQASPFYFFQFIRKTPTPSKTMFRETHTVWVHAFADGSKGSLAIYELIEKLENAMLFEIVLPGYVTLIQQINRGTQTIIDEETGEKHAVIEFDFDVSYGFKAKI